MTLFDRESAKNDGYSDAEIDNFIKANSANFDRARAKKDGWTDEEIDKFVRTGKGFDRSANIVHATGRGINVGLTALAGAPVDLLNLGLKQIGLGADRPFAGSESIRGGLESVSGLIGESPTYFAPRSVEDMPPEERPFGYAGQVIGGLPIAALPFLGAAKLATPIAKAKGIFAPIVEAAARNPRMFTSAEVGSILGAAQLSALSEAVLPGHDITRTVAEVAGGVTNPLSLIAKVSPTVKSGVGAVRGAFGKGAVERRAAEKISKTVKQFQEDPEALAKALEKADAPGLEGLTAGQKTGSRALLALEAKLGVIDPVFAADAAQRHARATENLRTQISELTKGQDALTQAGVSRQKRFDGILSSRLATADERAVSAIEAAKRSGTKVDASEIQHETLRLAISDARSVERFLWGKIAQRGAGTTATRGGYKEARANLLPKEKFSTEIEDFIAKMEGGQFVKSGQLSRLRSLAMSDATKAAAGGDRDLARRLSLIADGALDDLSKVQGVEATVARDYSKSLHDAFTRSFAGKGLGTAATGEARISPELLLERAFGTGGDAANLRLRQLSEAAGFPVTKAVVGDQPLTVGLKQRAEAAQENFLALAAKDLADPITGRFAPRRLKAFLDDNAATLNRFPGLKRQLSDVNTAEQTFTDVIAGNKAAVRAASKRAAFSKLIGTEKPSLAVSQALSGKTPARDYAGFARLAKSGDAVDGLRAATIDAARIKAVSGDKFSFVDFRRALIDPLSTAHPSAMKLMEANKVIDPAQAGNLKFIIRRGEAIETAVKEGAHIKDVIESPDMLTDLITRIVGAQVASRAVPAQTLGSGLIVAQAGSKAAKTLLNKIPGAKTVDFMIEVSKNKELMASLLRKSPHTRITLRRLERQINAFLWQTAIPDSEESK